MPFSALTTAETDADSPLDTTLMTKLKDNFDDLDAARVTNGDSHDHSGGDGAVIPQGGIGARAVGQGQLKTALGSVSTTGAATLTLPGGEYGFYPQTKSSQTNFGSASIVAVSIGTSYVTNIHLNTEGVAGMYAQQRYIQASPPYKIGSKKWGHFLFLLRRISDGVVISSYEAEDPCWAYNGKTHLPKDHADRISAVPHPFVDYWDKDPAIDGLEVVLVDLSITNTKKWIGDNRKIGKGILEDVGAVMVGKGKGKQHTDYGIQTIPNFTNKVKIVTP